MLNVFFKEIVLDDKGTKALVRVGCDTNREDNVEGDLFVEQRAIVGTDLDIRKTWFTDMDKMWEYFNSINGPEDLVFDISKVDRMIDGFKIFNVENTQVLFWIGNTQDDADSDDEECNSEDYIGFLALTPKLGEVSLKFSGYESYEILKEYFYKIDQELADKFYSDQVKPMIKNFISNDEQ